MRHEALVFDLDGVLIDTEATLYSVWMQVFADYGCSFTRAEWHALVGMAIGVASSSPRSWVSARLEQLRVVDRVHGVVCGGESHRSKPAPDLYLAVCEQLGVSPDRAVAVEDSRNGMLAARAAGLACVVVPNQATLDMTFDGADHLLTSLTEMRLIEVLDLLERSAQPEP